MQPANQHRLSRLCSKSQRKTEKSTEIKWQNVTVNVMEGNTYRDGMTVRGGDFEYARTDRTTIIAEFVKCSR